MEKNTHPWYQPINSKTIMDIFESVTDAIQDYLAYNLIDSVQVDKFKSEIESLSYKIELHRKIIPTSGSDETGKIYVSEVKVERRENQLIVEPKVQLVT